MTINGNHLTAAEGMVLTNGSSFSTEVYLGIHDSPANWREIPVEDAVEPTTPSADELASAARILLGWEDV